MEKRVFSLTDKSRILFLALSSICWIAWLGMNLAIGHSLRDPWRWYSSLLTLALLVLVHLAALWAERVRSLEISDQGLVLKRWLRKPLSIDWKMVSSVRKSQDIQSFRLYMRYQAAVIKDVAGRRIAIGDACRRQREIVNILKQRLPESAFVAR